MTTERVPALREDSLAPFKVSLTASGSSNLK